MAFREVRVFEVREVLRLWLRGEGIRSTERLAGVDRKTVRRYLAAAQELGVVRDGGEEQLRDELVGAVVEAVRPHRSDGHGEAWQLLVANHELIVGWLAKDDMTVRKTRELLARRGVVVPERTLHRYALEVCDVGRGRRGTTVRVADGEPGDECQVDFGRLGLVPDPTIGRCRVCHALVFTPVVSRYTFVWLSFRQTIEDVIAGCEAAWVFYDGVFSTLIPDNLKAIVEHADATEPRLNQAFVEYAQARGFVVDPARVRSPQDKPRVERAVPFVRQSFFAGEDFVDLADAQRRADVWCRGRAGMRPRHDSGPPRRGVPGRGAAPAPAGADLALRPADLHDGQGAPRSPHRGGQGAVLDTGHLIGTPSRCGLIVRVRVFSRGQLMKIDPRQAPGGRSTDPADLPAERTAYALRDLDTCAGWPPATGPPSAPSPGRCSTRRCPGRACARSTRCWVW